MQLATQRLSLLHFVVWSVGCGIQAFIIDTMKLLTGRDLLIAFEARHLDDVDWIFGAFAPTASFQGPLYSMHIQEYR